MKVHEPVFILLDTNVRSQACLAYSRVILFEIVLGYPILYEIVIWSKRLKGKSHTAQPEIPASLTEESFLPQPSN